MTQSIFSTYSTGENRVTSSILAVLTHLSIRRIERILGALTQNSSFELVRFQNQVSAGTKSVPDAMISSHCRLLVETKIKRGAVDQVQLKQHLTQFKGDGAFETLLVITPDPSQPIEINNLGDQRVAWASFGALYQVIDELLGDTGEVVSERETFLLRQLQIMLVTEKLIQSENDVLVVPARYALREYEIVNAYVCQPERTFQPVKFLAFYADKGVHPVVPQILESHESVIFERGRYTGQLQKVVDCLLDAGARDEGMSYKVLLLTSPDDERTIRLIAPIPNNLRSAAGRIVAFTQNQRYVQLDKLKLAHTTSDLVKP